MLQALLHSKGRQRSPAPGNGTIDEAEDSLVPHQIRGFVRSFGHVTPTVGNM